MKKILLIAVGSALLLSAILFGAFFAGPLFASAQTAQSQANASGTPTTQTTNTYCEQYLQDLAGRLHVSVATLQQDKLSAMEDVIARMVKDGKLTQKQANAIVKQLESHQACTGNKGVWGPRVVVSSLRQYVPQMESQVAQGLHLSTTQLQSDLKSGMSLAQVAKQQKVTTAQLKTIVQGAIQNAVNQAVHDGNLTQAQGSAVMQYLQNHPGVLDRILTRHFASKK